MSHAHDRGNGVMASSDYMGWEQSKGDWWLRGNPEDLLKGGKRCWVGKANRHSLLHRLWRPLTHPLLLITCNSLLLMMCNHWTLNTKCFRCLSLYDILSQNEFFPTLLPRVRRVTHSPSPASQWGYVAFSCSPVVFRTFLLLCPGYLNTKGTHCWKGVCC